MVANCGLIDAVADCDRPEKSESVKFHLDRLNLEACFMHFRVPLLFMPQPEGGFTVTSPSLPELIAEGDTLDEAFANAQDALAAVVEIYADENRQLPVVITPGCI
jgi:antitoxin HicB